MDIPPVHDADETTPAAQGRDDTPPPNKETPADETPADESPADGATS